MRSSGGLHQHARVTSMLMVAMSGAGGEGVVAAELLLLGEICDVSLGGTAEPTQRSQSSAHHLR
jgi:hypothetical protein